MIKGYNQRFRQKEVREQTYANRIIAVFFLHDYALLAIEKTNKYLKKIRTKQNQSKEIVLVEICGKHCVKNMP